MRFRSWKWNLPPAHRAVIDFYVLGAKHCDLRRLIEAFDSGKPVPADRAPTRRTREFLGEIRRDLRRELLRAGLLD